MDIARVELKEIVAASLKLPGDIDPEISLLVGSGIPDAAGIKLREQSEEADLDVLTVKALLVCGAQIGRPTLEHGAPVGEIDAQGTQKMASRRPIDAGFGEDVRIPPRIGAGAEYALRQCTRHQCGGGRRRRKLGTRVGKTPGRQRVPDILHA